jgi:hypothetical protein
VRAVSASRGAGAGGKDGAEGRGGGRGGTMAALVPCSSEDDDASVHAEVGAMLARKPPLKVGAVVLLGVVGCCWGLLLQAVRRSCNSEWVCARMSSFV